MKDKPEGEVSDEEWRLKHNEAGDEKMDTDDCNEDSASVNDAGRDHDITDVSMKRMSEYQKSREKNIAALKGELAKLDEKYPLPEEFKRKNELKTPANKKKDKVKQADVVRRESTRNKDQSR